jgi:predicted metal-dependent phosphoesterase TrpH
MMDFDIDLHVHSSASDGSFSPSELAGMAAESKLSLVSLTDHDTVSGIPEFMETAGKHPGVTAVPGVEISSHLEGHEFHILGYFIDYENPKLLDLLAGMRAAREKRNTGMITKLNAAGYKITEADVRKFAPVSECPGRPHFARALVEKGYFPDRYAAFEKCLAKGGSGYLPRQLPSPELAIQTIHDAGGLAFWAHPVYREKGDRSNIRKLLKKLLKAGVDGLEAYYLCFTQNHASLLAEFAKEYSLPISAGSDFHGLNMPKVKLAAGLGSLTVPPEAREIILSYFRAHSREDLAAASQTVNS